MTLPEPVVPDYGGACINGVIPALLSGARPPAWLPEPLVGARQVVVLVLDGLGWEQMQQRRHLTPMLSSMEGGPITSVAPSTTATALTSIVTGLTPGEHGIAGYRMHVGDGQVLNVLRWRTAQGDARESVPPQSFRTTPGFCGQSVPAVVKAEFESTGFTDAHLHGTRLHGWRVTSTLVLEVEQLLAAGEPFIYAYYDGVDKVAHEFGLQRHYDAELAFVDRLVAELAAVLPPDAALAVISDHGQVDVGDKWEALDQGCLEGVWLMPGEGRFLWMHCEPGAAGRVQGRLVERYADRCWVRSLAEIRAEGWFGPTLTQATESRLGDVAVLPFEPIALLDPAATGEVRLRSRHGSLTPAEMWVPLLAVRGSTA
jgi:hypothetical protein